jgi:hypothetical protein
MAPTVTAPVRVPPWDEPWVTALRITKPMLVTLYGAQYRGYVEQLYPGGQWRLIRAGLYRRGLTDQYGHLTMCGHVAAIWASAAVRRVWPDADDNAGGECA